MHHELQSAGLNCIMLSFWSFLVLFTLQCNSHVSGVDTALTTVNRSSSRHFTFPERQSTILPDPSTFFLPKLLSAPLPTNYFFQNFVLKKGDQPEYIHPYLIKSSLSSLSVSYPAIFSNTSFTQQIFNPDINISVLNNPNPKQTHVISSFNDLSVTLDIQTYLRFFLVRGSPFVTCKILKTVELSILTIHTILDLIPNSSKTKYKISLNNGQTWNLYSSSPISLTNIRCPRLHLTISVV